MLTAARIVDGIAGAHLSAVEIVEEALARIAAIDGEIHAWVCIDRAGALRAAREREAAASGPGPLNGVPIGIKDIIDVAGLPTAAGARPFAHRVPGRDATVVQMLRRAGAIIIGKTVTTEFAYLDPGPTRNPWHLDHTPGGSSSGSAAAVAAGMVPVALGSQTVGSVLRPAAYCGVAGFKPSYGRISTEGVVPLAWSLDHIGIFARDVQDVALVFRAVTGDSSAGAHDAALRPRLGVPRGFFAGHASAAVNAHVDDVAARLAGAGAHAAEVPFPSLEEWRSAGMPILAAETATYHAGAFARHAREYGHHIRSIVETGLGMLATEYVLARQAQDRLRSQAASLFKDVDALLLPVAPTVAPAGLASTGDASLCAPASFTGFPSVALPSGLDESGLPLAIQLVGPPGRDIALLAIAGWVEQCLDFRRAPALTGWRDA